MLCYVDNVLAMHHDAMSRYNKSTMRFLLKVGSVGDPNIHLGAKLRKVTFKS
jgi:hypothetical protein